MAAATPGEALSITRRPYRRPFARPLAAAWGTWSVREGVIVRAQDGAGRAGFGEAAPLPGWGDPAAAEAFALWTARQALQDSCSEPVRARTAALLKLDEMTRDEMATLRPLGFRTWKIKLGVAEPAAEWLCLQQVVVALADGETLRLDPNRSWDAAAWQFWRPRINGIAARVQFIEEPFTPAVAPEELQRLAETSPAPLALDESLCGGGLDAWLARGWPGWWVVKPSLMGEPDNWLAPLSSYTGRVVISSAFETAIGMGALLRLAQRFPGTDHGLGTGAWFDDDLGAPVYAPEVISPTLEQQEALWNSLPGA